MSLCCGTCAFFAGQAAAAVSATRDFQIRSAQGADLADLLRICNYYVENSHSTFDLEPFDLENRKQWLSNFSTQGRYRLLVALVDSTVVGYATSTRFRYKPAYDPLVETTVYLDPNHVGCGLGSALYEELFAALEPEDVHRAFAGIALPNPASQKLHERFGFRLVGTFSEAGRKFGRYWDVSWYEKAL